MKLTPIGAWPLHKFSGRPGYSAKHFAAVSGGEDDPLRVAERVAARIDGGRIAREAGDRIARGEDPGTVSDWMTKEITETRARRWAELCASFDEVIEILSGEPPTPAIRRLIREAKTAAKRSA